MKYLSRNGCLFYFDRNLYKWQFCEPTMLFLLGFESATSFDNSGSDELQISRYSYHSYNNTLVEYKDFEIFDRIYGFLSLLGSVDDNELYSSFDCNGAKLLLSEYTGIALDRTIPVIFKDDINRSAIDLNSTMNRLAGSVYTNYSINDLRAQKIHDIFDDADYSNPAYKSTDLLSTQDTDDDIALSIVEEYNEEATALHEERKFNNNVYRLIDYKAMYSYALGVLYGCRCLGYHKEAIWRLDPKFWYNGQHKNLIDTAWRVFRFHYTEQLHSPDDAYQEIVLNKLWNFTNDSNSDVELKSDEVNVSSVGIDTDSNSAVIKPIIYSHSDNTYIPLYGSQIELNNWVAADSSIISSDANVPVMDLIDQDGISYIRYIGTSVVKLFPAYRYKYIVDGVHEYEYLKDYCFTSAGNLGWVKYSKNDFNHTLQTNANFPSLSLYPKPLSGLEHTHTRSIFDKSNCTLLTAYVCSLNYYAESDFCESNRVLIGLAYDFGTDMSFNKLICGNYEYRVDEFNVTHTQLNLPEPYINQEGTPVGIVKVAYNLFDKIHVIASYSDNTLIWTGNDAPNDFISMFEFGYSYYKSTNLPVYIEYNDEVVSSNLRCYILSNSIYFWDQSNPTNGFVPQLLTDPKLLPLGNYMLFDTASLYRNINRIVSNTSIYSDEFKISHNTVVADQDTSRKYVYYNNEFVLLSSLYNEQGITEYLCQIIYEDDFGNSLLDIDGNPLVWYDEYNQMYWNGLSLSPAWQSEKPRLLVGVTMYDSSENLLLPIIDNTSTHEVTINDVTITYNEFYSNDNYGIIRETLNVFSTLSGMIDCYYDSYSDEYCIPNVTSEWVPRSFISSLGYRFVDGIETLYDGVEEVEVVTDSDDTD